MAIFTPELISSINNDINECAAKFVSAPQIVMVTTKVELPKDIGDYFVIDKYGNKKVMKYDPALDEWFDMNGKKMDKPLRWGKDIDLYNI